MASSNQSPCFKTTSTFHSSKCNEQNFLKSETSAKHDALNDSWMQGFAKTDPSLTNHFTRWLNEFNYRKGENFIFIYILKQKYVAFINKIAIHCEVVQTRERGSLRLSLGERVKGIAEIFLPIFKINFHIGKTLDHVVQVRLGVAVCDNLLRNLVKTAVSNKGSPRSTCRLKPENKPANTTWFCDVKSNLCPSGISPTFSFLFSPKLSHERKKIFRSDTKTIQFYFKSARKDIALP